MPEHVHGSWTSMGLDLSLTRSGIAVLNDGGSVLTYHAHETKSYLQSGDKHGNGEILLDTYKRVTTEPKDQLFSLCDVILGLLDAYDPSVVYIEEPLFFQNPRVTMQLDGVMFLVVDRITAWYRSKNQEPPISLIAGSSVKKHAGIVVKKGMTSAQKKILMVEAANKKWGLTLLKKQDDEADAMFLADMARVDLGGAMPTPVRRSRLNLPVRPTA